VKVYIEFDTDNACFEDNFEGSLMHVLTEAALKIPQQMIREPSLCKHPESADILMDINGNTIGCVRLEY
jgi:hypothetical protein